MIHRCIYNDRKHLIGYSVLLVVSLLLTGRADAKTGCLPDNSLVEVTGVIEQVTDRDKHDEKLYSYFIINTQKAYCLSGPEVDVRSSTPVYDMTILPRTNGQDQQELGPYVGYNVMATGKLLSSNFGGPQLYYYTIKRIARND